MNKFFTLLAAALMLSFFVACGGGGEEKTETPAEQMTQKAETMATGGYMATDVTGGGAIKGTVTYAGAIPQKTKIDVTKDVNVCGQKTHYKQDLVISEGNKGLANVVIRIKNIDKGKALSTLGDNFVLDQHGCEFVPHVSIVPVGAQLTIRNSDGILHNIHTYSEKNEPINMAQPGFKKTMTHAFSEPEVVRVACDVHNWMGGYIAVVNQPYVAKTDENGNFELTDVPAGTYTLEYWQETLGRQSKDVTVTEGGEVDASLEYAAGSANADDTSEFASLK